MSYFNDERIDEANEIDYKLQHTTQPVQDVPKPVSLIGKSINNLHDAISVANKRFEELGIRLKPILNSDGLKEAESNEKDERISTDLSRSIDIATDKIIYLVNEIEHLKSRIDL